MFSYIFFLLSALCFSHYSYFPQNGRTISYGTIWFYGPSSRNQPSLSSLSLFLQMMVNGEKERVSLLVSRGSVDAVSQQMASHPQYLESFLRTQHYILHMDGPLPLPYRHYIAIMVSDLAFLSRIHPNPSPAVIM